MIRSAEQTEVLKKLVIVATKRVKNLIALTIISSNGVTTAIGHVGAAAILLDAIR